MSSVSLVPTVDLIRHLFRAAKPSIHEDRLRTFFLHPTQISKRNAEPLPSSLMPVQKWEKEFTHPTDCAALSPDGSVLAMGCMDGYVRLGRAAVGEKLGKLRLDESFVTALLFSKQGDILFAGTPHRLFRFHFTTDKNGRSAIRPDWMTLAEGVQSLAPSPDGKMIAVGARNSSMIRWFKTGSLTEDPNDQFKEEGHKTVLKTVPASMEYIPDQGMDSEDSLDREITSVDYSPDGAFLAAGTEDSKLFLIDVSNHKILAQWKLDGFGIHVFFAPDGKSISAVGSRGLWQIDLDKMLPKKIKDFSYLHGADESIYTTSAAFNREIFATAGSGKKVYIMTRQGRLLAEVSLKELPWTLFLASKGYKENLFIAYGSADGRYSSNGRLARYSFLR